MKRLAFIALLLASGCVTADVVPYDVVRELAPTGKLRAAINFGNGVLAQKDPKTGEARGVSVDLAREVAKRAGIPLEIVPYDAAGKVSADATQNRWDIAFVARDPDRAKDIEFTAPYVIIEGTYLVAQDSPLRAVEDIDRDGIRVAVGRGSAYDLFLTRSLKHAQLVRSPTSPEAPELFLREKLDAAAGVRQQLEYAARMHPGLRVMEGRFMAIEQAMALPRGRPQAARYLRGFIDEMKASGFVQQSLDKSGQKEAQVAP